MHGGRIGVVSEGEGKGSIFYVELPLIPKVNETHGITSSRVCSSDEFEPMRMHELTQPSRRGSFTSKSSKYTSETITSYSCDHCFLS
jgi:hypothetical protein